MIPRRTFYSAFVVLMLCAYFPAKCLAATVIPPGNQNATQPKIPGGSLKRSQGASFEKKYQKIYRLLQSDEKLIKKIKTSARKFGIDPIHIVGALVGEHTYNVDAKDRLQTYYVKALAYVGQKLTFKFEDTTISQLVKHRPFQRCQKLSRDYDRWSCRETVWNQFYRGKYVANKKWPNKRLGVVFFQPLYAGQTFGLGQLNPLTALKVNDMVLRKVPGELKLTMDNAPEIYKTIMNPDSTINYMAAVIRHSIESYRLFADFDISQNPGITATLYNLGNVSRRAKKLAEQNRSRTEPLLPRENYYGWLVNEKLGELKKLL